MKPPREPRPRSQVEHGLLPANVMHFTRLLRAAGFTVGPGRTLDAIRALERVGVARRSDVYWALHAVLVSGPDEREIFGRAFELFWRHAFGAGPGLAEARSTIEGRPPGPAEPLPRRLAEAVAGPRSERTVAPAGAGRGTRVLTWSDQERLRTRDFEDMSVEELREAQAIIASMRLGLRPRRTRRFRSSSVRDRVDVRATLRTALRSSPDLVPLRWRTPRLRPPPLVVLCDISGSMERYARVLLRFLHALTNERERVHTFLFGTRLTNVTRALRHSDVDRALSDVGRLSRDWSGGTRIGACLRRFNHDWSRRVLAQGAIVLLVTDGLDREGGADVGREAARLRRSSRRVIWLNPLLRYGGFEPLAAGVRALLPHVDEFRPVHDLESLEDLARVLARVP